MKKRQENFHSLNPKEILKELDSNIRGLSQEQVDALKIKYGPNKIPEKKPTSPIVVIFRQFNSLMVYILIAAALISFLLHKMIDVYVIAVVIIINAAIGFSQEYKAESAIRALKKMIVPLARVYRGGDLVQIPAHEIVPGDILVLEEGDRIPADARLIEIKNFRTVESSLTGESLPADKFLKLLPEKTPLADRKNMVWLGTFVASGRARAVVTATGADTAIGELAESIESIKPGKSHFQEKTDTLAKHLAIIAGIGALLTFLIGYFLRGLPFLKIFEFTLASLVSGIPEGLPAVLAIVLAIGSYRMAKRKAVVRDKYATETLGMIDTVVTDKTGTLTENTMTIQEIFLPGQLKIGVTGVGWEPKGEFIQKSKQIIPLENKQLDKLLHIAANCNNSRLIREKDEKGEEKYSIIGDPTEAALLTLAEKAGLKRSALLQKEKRLDDLPFNPGLKYHASLSVLSDKGNSKEIYVIGAPEAVLDHSTHLWKTGRKAKLTKPDIKHLEKSLDSMTNKAMRVLAIAYREAPKNLNELSEEDTKDLVLIGFVGMSDPPREEVKGAIERAKGAGIRVIMATGDHKNTAVAIAKQIGLVKEDSKKPFMAITGAELEAMSDQAFDAAIKKANIFARLTPEVKLRIAKSLQKNGHIVAMTGDGVNDAPALKQADVGVAMGIVGTDVARESSSVVLIDDNFASIVNAVEEGRTVFVNTRQTSYYLAMASISEHATIIATMSIGLPLPLLATQILWLNLVSAGVIDVSLASEQSHHDVLREKPKKKGENILNKSILPFIIGFTIITALLSLAFFKYYLPNEPLARTAVFSVIAFTHLFNVFNMRSLTKSAFKIGLFSNRYIVLALTASVLALLLAIYTPFLQGVLGFAHIPLRELAVIFLLSSLALWFGEIYKAIKNTSKKPTSEE